MSFQGRNNPPARWADVQRMLHPLRNRLMSVAARAWVRLVFRDSPMQRLQVEVLEGELKDRIEHFQPYGFTSAPLETMDALVHFLGGDRAHGIVSVVADRATRPRTLAEGDVAIYHRTDAPEKSAENATPRITLTIGRLVIRVAELDIKCGRSRLRLSDEGLIAEANSFRWKEI